MLTREEDIDAHALARQGWTISAIARHLGRDRKTIRAYLAGNRTPGARARTTPDPFAPYAEYCRARLAEDPHLWATTLYDEVTDLGYPGAYQTFTRQLRQRQLRPVCQDCRPTAGRAVAVIEHPPGEETQWDWVELPDPPAAWGAGANAHLLVGALAHSGAWRGLLCESEDQAHLIAGIDHITRALGGVTKVWRFDRMATVCHPPTGKVTATFAAVAKHYGVSVAICPPRRGNRKGVVEKAVHSAAQRVWRTLPDEATVESAQAALDRWCTTRGDARARTTAEGRTTVAALAAAESLGALPPVPFPAVTTVERKVSAQALVAYRGNSYSVAPELAHATVTVIARLGEPHLDIATSSGAVIARHRAAAPGAGAMVRDHGHVTALNTEAMKAATSAVPHRSKVRIPPGPDALAAAAVLRGTAAPASTTTSVHGAEEGAVVIDLSRYAAAANGRNTLT
ncbi:IS21 family transposase [Kocuria oceani]|uniref:IS21 family transposase n=1 Tax=Kocuria oceani TaxID=988827 RepID=A0ABV9TN65_9MICC|nr:IS21 family transposase [Kocuria oceani]